MEYNKKIRVLREIRQWSQEDMAEKLNMSVNGYAKIERGETKLTLNKLEQIANIFNMDALEFMQNANNGVYFMMNEVVDNNTIYYGTNEISAIEIEKLKLSLQLKDNIIFHSEELLKSRDLLLEQKQREIDSLKEIIALLKEK
ncbi:MULTISPECIES: helix-turn-helix transcriptional regulator [Mannheimia]|uniref:Helix-turn-helix transcriptional regulator n=1 Tax=Mannheimia pernigra TaxID=111844 RepID=A0ABD7A641_9PAST|nr:MULTISPECIES: helix-turn-helix transcriptional regulator [Mannheimia]QLB41408.1 helix-turn-helix transcriptional regulator [Mannheimia pernigra]QLB43334.1 helix-turn-helix transcriptional regulator [Mannheimia pernigra]QTM01353.1 helix-turn-helix domain-containing protein [Mannheimia sp. ZY171111]